MAQRTHTPKKVTSKKAPETAQPGEQKTTKRDELLEDIDDILDEVDEVLEENAEEFVKAYVQKGGE